MRLALGCGPLAARAMVQRTQHRLSAMAQHNQAAGRLAAPPRHVGSASRAWRLRLQRAGNPAAWDSRWQRHGPRGPRRAAGITAGGRRAEGRRSAGARQHSEKQTPVCCSLHHLLHCGSHGCMAHRLLTTKCMPHFAAQVSLKLQKRLAASVLGCGLRKVWLDPNEVNDISMANSREWRSRGSWCSWHLVCLTCLVGVRACARGAAARRGGRQQRAVAAAAAGGDCSWSRAAWLERGTFLVHRGQRHDVGAAGSSAAALAAMCGTRLPWPWSMQCSWLARQLGDGSGARSTSLAGACSPSS